MSSGSGQLTAAAAISISNAEITLQTILRLKAKGFGLFYMAGAAVIAYRLPQQ